MPELPEVECFKIDLNKTIPLKINSLEYTNKHSSLNFNPKRIKHLRQKTITQISRHGKKLFFHFDVETPYLLYSHLGMSGSWRIAREKIIEKHCHFQIQGFTQKSKEIYLGYVDPRRFGRLEILTQEEFDQLYGKAAPDLASADFNLDWLKRALEHYSNRALKPHLLDQNFFPGCGNYMANEICARAKILPTRKCRDISVKEYKKILSSIQIVLDQSLNSGGVSFHGGYTDSKGEKGKGVQNLVVFHQPLCLMCKKAQVQKIIQAQRGTFFCPRCQK